ncbi:beta-ketoacyl synthase N-terminal-like domain-containing protein, partial [Nocardiopsis sp. NPDC058631]|uniref:beta-ketoacyl synthase N-terminal-like domain-containing protein n=1 Tax=Nocardiopsis sp. NPDC058631 TaxID=3346566 RepID=UPI0036467CF3
MSVESGGLRGQGGLFPERDGWDEAIAVVGLSCRLPKAPDPESFWAMLRSGGHGLDEPPADRRTPGAGTSRAGYLDGVGDFDAAFFGISPREAVAMDPQQRIVLELAWEALEDAGIVPETVRDTPAGVFVGSLRDDYAIMVGQRGEEAITQNTMTGVSRGLIANRVSYHLGLTGPSLTVDAAQASSLVAVHMACASLRTGESSLALAAGINLNILPEGELVEERFGALSPDGRCYTFDARANGFVRGEGGGVVVLQPLDQALAQGRRVYGVIRGSAVNNDGATAGLTVPGERTQCEVLRRAYERADVVPESVQYVELHGTGTPTGDPVEAAALGDMIGRHRSPTEPLYVGSVKTNIGHLEGAAGIAGLIKVLLSLHHRELPPSLNFETPNPRIPMEELNLSVRSEAGAWPYTDRPLLAGVSSFGMGGTNCHVVVEEAPESQPCPEPGDQDHSAVAWVVSARSEGALRAQAGRLVERVRGDVGVSVCDVGFSLVSSRAVMPVRGVVVGSGRGELLEGL